MITPCRFFEQARTLSASLKEEDHRTAISRGYYSLYHEAFQFLASSKYRQKLVQMVKGHLKYRDENQKKKQEYKMDKIENLDTVYLNEIDVNMHGIIQKTIQRIATKEAFGVSKNFGAARKKRNRADYDIQSEFDMELTTLDLDEIEKAIVAVRKL